MTSSILNTLWGNLTREEYKNFGLLSAALSFIVGTYWILRPIKDAFFASMVGTMYLPYAKIASIIFLIPVILLYSKLVDIFEKQKLIYIITSCYGVFFILVALVLSNSSVAITNITQQKHQILGWIIYLGTESYILVILTLFWSFVASSTDVTSAKHGYALILTGAQIGTIIGSEFAKHASPIGIPLLIIISAAGILTVPLVIMIYTKHHLQKRGLTVSQKKSSTGSFEGLRLLLTKPYLLGILCIATFGEIISTILEFGLIYRAKETYHSAERITEFLGLYGQCINFFTLIFTFLGTSFIIRKYGLTLPLVTYPIIVGILVYCVWCYPTLWVFFASMVTLKCLSYALNSPCKEIMYIPTSTDIKFKTKGWIDTIGYRLAQSLGGTVGVFFPTITALVFFGSIISFGVIAIWIAAAIYVGKKNQYLIEMNETID